MNQTIARTFLFLAACTLALGQPTVPVSNLSPLNSGTVVGRTDSGTGRAQTLTAGPGITIANGTISSSGGATAAPAAATYILRTANATLTNAQVLSSLSSGVVTVTTGTGVLASTAPGLAGNVLTSNGTGWASTIPAYTGNVTAAGTLDSGNIVIGQAGKAVATSSVFSISGSNATVSGNLTITGGTTFNNLTTANLTVSGNITATGVGNGTLLIGNATGSKFDVASLTQGSGVTITPGAGSITISATGSGGNVTGSGLTANAIVVGAGSNAVAIGASPGTIGNVLTSNGTNWVSATAAIGNVTVSGTPTSGQLASWTSATNLQGITSANVTQGGTGQASLTANNIITGNGTGAVTFIAPGTSGNIVTSNGTAFNSAAPTWFGSAIVSGCTTVTANSTGNLTFASANANLTITTDNTAKTVTFNATGGGGSGNVTASAGASTYIPVFTTATNIAGTTAFTYDDSTGKHQLRKDQNGNTYMSIRNDNTGTSALAYLVLESGSNGVDPTLNLFANKNWSAVAEFTGKGGVYTGSGNLVLAGGGGSSGIDFYAGGVGSGQKWMTLSTAGTLTVPNVVGTTALFAGGVPASASHIKLEISGGLAYIEANTAASAGVTDMNLVGTTLRILTTGFAETARFTGAKNLLVGTTSETGLTGAGGLRVASTTASSSTTTGAAIISGGLGVAGKIYSGSDDTTSGDFVTDTIGKTLKVKSGSNSKAGTFTLSSGAATVSNSSVTANSVVVMSLKTASGTITAAPYLTAITASTSFVVAGAATDNSTYNYIILEVN